VKILFLYHHLPHPITGGGITPYSVLKALKAYPIEVHLATLNTNKFFRDPAEFRQLATEIFTVPINIDVQIGSALKNLFFSSLPYSLERYASHAFRDLLRELAKKESYDLIHIDATQMGLYIEELKRFRCPILLRPHNVEYEIFSRLAQNMKNPLKRVYYQILAKRMKAFETNLLKEIDFLVPHTRRDLQHFQQMGYRGDAEIIPVGEWRDECRFIPVEEEENSIGFIGSLNWNPNLEGLLWFFKKVVPLLIQKEPNLSIEIAGRFPPPWLKRYASSNVRILGPVPDSKAFLRKHAVIISPLLSGSGIRVKIIEAMSQSKYVVSTTIGAEGIAEKDSDFLRIADTPEDFASKILEGLYDTVLRQKVKTNAYNHVLQHYTWENTGRAFWHVYQKVSKLTAH